MISKRQVKTSRQMRIKRQREWVYLAHFIYLKQLQVDQVVSGADDGKEPDFTLIVNGRWIGVELTTLTNQRDYLGDRHLLLRRQLWRWRNTYRTRTRTVIRQMPTIGWLNQDDIDSVMARKSKKTQYYRQRRPLDELWLLIHTHQAALPSDHLSALKKKHLHYWAFVTPKAVYHTQTNLTHQSDFDKVYVTLYPTLNLVEL